MLNLFLLKFEGRFCNNLEVCKFQVSIMFCCFLQYAAFGITLHHVSNDSEWEAQYCCLLLVFMLRIHFFKNKSVAVLSLFVCVKCGRS